MYYFCCWSGKMRNLEVPECIFPVGCTYADAYDMSKAYAKSITARGGTGGSAQSLWARRGPGIL